MADEAALSEFDDVTKISPAQKWTKPVIGKLGRLGDVAGGSSVNGQGGQVHKS